MGATRDWLSLGTKSETDWYCSHNTDVGRDDNAPDYAYYHFCLHLLVGSSHWASGVVCAAPVTTDTAGHFRSRSCLYLMCMLDHHGMHCCYTLLPMRTTWYSFLHRLHYLVFGALLDAQILKADLCWECPKGWASFNMRGGREVGFEELLDLLLWGLWEWKTFSDDGLQQYLLSFL